MSTTLAVMALSYTNTIIYKVLWTITFIGKATYDRIHFKKVHRPQHSTPESPGRDWAAGILILILDTTCASQSLQQMNKTHVLSTQGF